MKAILPQTSVLANEIGSLTDNQCERLSVGLRNEKFQHLPTVFLQVETPVDIICDGNEVFTVVHCVIEEFPNLKIAVNFAKQIANEEDSEFSTAEFHFFDSNGHEIPKENIASVMFVS